MDVRVASGIAGLGLKPQLGRVAHWEAAPLMLSAPAAGTPLGFAKRSAQVA